MSKIIGNRFGAFGTLSTGELAPREEEVHIANATIAAGVSVEFDTSYAITNGHMRVITSDAANAVKNVGVSLTGAGAGDEVRVVVRGPVQMTSNATVAVGTGVGTTAAGLAAAPRPRRAPSRTSASRWRLSPPRRPAGSTSPRGEVRCSPRADPLDSLSFSWCWKARPPASDGGRCASRRHPPASNYTAVTSWRMSPIKVCSACSLVLAHEHPECPNCEGPLVQLRPCAGCGVYDGGQRHVIAGISLVPLDGVDSEYRHLECCAATGCPDCINALSEQGVLTNG
jgi:hypothetical protein